MKQSYILSIGCIVLCLVAICFTFTTPSFSGNTESREVIKLETRSGVTQKFVLVKPSNPVAAVVLISGGKGNIGVGTSNGKPTIKYDRNFLVKSREKFAKNGLMVAVMDAPSDKRSKGMNLRWRIGQKHAQDIRAVVSNLKQQANLPVWLVGTSNGTFSTCNAAIDSQDSINGIVLTSSITTLEAFKKKLKIYKTHPNGILDMDLGEIKVPALVVSHKDDQCPATPAANDLILKSKFANSSKVENLSFTGGKSPKSKPCKALSQHGFYGIEDQVVTAIADYIKAN